MLRESLETSHFDFQQKPTWNTTLFFPPEWPPELVRDFLEPPIASVDSGIHLPIKSDVDHWVGSTTSYVETGFGWQRVPPDPFTQKSIEFMMQVTLDLPHFEVAGKVWSVAYWFPEFWSPAAIDDYLEKEHWQDSFFPF